MNIVQSYALTKNPYYLENKSEILQFHLNFYTFLLSCLTLQEYAGPVTMYCDRLVYDKIAKYIPYDNIVIKENKFKDDGFGWSFYKMETIRDLECPYIHVDSDVFIFDRIFDEYANNPEHKVICQDYSHYHKRDEIIEDTTYFHPTKDHLIKFIKPLYNNNEELFIEHNIIERDDEIGFVSGAINGIKLDKGKETYMSIYDKILELYYNGTLYLVPNTAFTHIPEEFALYYVDKHNIYDIFDGFFNFDYTKYTINDNNFFDYTYVHLQGSLKYKDESIKNVKKCIYEKYNKYYHLVEQFDNIIKQLRN